jgi:hypothetical protein
MLRAGSGALRFRSAGWAVHSAVHSACIFAGLGNLRFLWLQVTGVYYCLRGRRDEKAWFLGLWFWGWVIMSRLVSKTAQVERFDTDTVPGPGSGPGAAGFLP